MKKLGIFKKFNRWVNKLSLKALDNAYQGAIAIKGIEDKHFEGGKISPDTDKGKSIYEYFQGALESQLLRIRFNLTQFKINNFFNSDDVNTNEEDNQNLETNNWQTEIIEKLSFIESVINKYRDPDDYLALSQLPPAENNPKLKKEKLSPSNIPTNSSPKPLNQGISQILPGGFFHAAAQIRRELTPEYEQEVVNRLRVLRRQEKRAIRFLIMLIILPILVQVTTKTFIFQPLVDAWDFENKIALNLPLTGELKEQALGELSEFKESLEFNSLLGIAPEISEEKKQERIQKKAQEIFKKYSYKSYDGIANILADLCSFLTFVIIIVIGKDYFIALKGFLDRFFKGLNDVTKVFVFILLTDMFVGFHSAEGWEVILKALSSHFGLPENESFIYLFIATVPVIMDSIFKLLIFNYLTRRSPAAVAVYEKMNQ